MTAATSDVRLAQLLDHESAGAWMATSSSRPHGVLNLCDLADIADLPRSAVNPPRPAARAPRTPRNTGWLQPIVACALASLVVALATAGLLSLRSDASPVQPSVAAASDDRSGSAQEDSARPHTQPAGWRANSSLPKKPAKPACNLGQC